MKPRARIVFFPDSGLSLRLPLDMRDSTLTTAPVAPPRTARIAGVSSGPVGGGAAVRSGGVLECAGVAGADRRDERGEHEKRQHPERLLELCLPLGRLAVVR